MQRAEQQIHKAVVQHLRQRGQPGLLWWHTNNNIHMRGRRGHIQGAIKRGLGVRAGVSDILALHRGKFFALELKVPGGRPTEDQLAFHSDVRANGGFTCVAEGLDEALRSLETWGLLRGSTQSNFVSDQPSAGKTLGRLGATAQPGGPDQSAVPVRKARGMIGGAA